MKKDRRAGFRSAYSVERLLAIGQAVSEWFDNLDPPRDQTGPELLGVRMQAIYQWRVKGRGPRPLNMFKLWQLTGKPVFLLTETEREIFLHRNVEVPEGYPTLEAWQENPVPPPALADPAREPKAPEEEVQAVLTQPKPEEIPDEVIPKLVTASLAIMQAGLVQLETLLVNSRQLRTKPMKQKAVMVILRLIKALGLTVDDFHQDIERETDPAVLRGLEEVLGKVTSRKGEK